MSNLVIINTEIKQDGAGRFSLNDLHRASGGSLKHKPANWLRLDSVQELIEEIERCSDMSIDKKQFSNMRSEFNAKNDRSSDVRNDKHYSSDMRSGIKSDTQNLGVDKKQVSDMRLGISSSTQNLGSGPINVIHGGNERGTYVCKELVYCYAMWISPKFHLEVIRTFDRVVNQPKADPLTIAHNGALLVAVGEDNQLTVKAVENSVINPFNSHDVLAFVQRIPFELIPDVVRVCTMRISQRCREVERG